MVRIALWIKDKRYNGADRRIQKLAKR